MSVNEDGVRLASATPWIPQSKPFAFIEYGCPAVDKGANQPNVFIDPKKLGKFCALFLKCHARRRDPAALYRGADGLLAGSQ